MPFEKRRFGRTDLLVSPFAIGGGYGALPGIFERAFDAGINTYFYSSFFPTYIPMMKWLRSKFSAMRDRFVLMTATYFWRFAGSIERSVCRHLSWLRAEYIDVFLLGWVKSVDQMRAFETLERLKEKKLIRFIGMSAHNRRLFVEAMKIFPLDVIMVRYNIAHRGAETEVFPDINDGQGVMAFNALKHGKVIKKPAGWDESKGKIPTAEEAYRFVLSNDRVHVCLAGPMRAFHLEGISKAMEKGRIDKERIDQLRTLGDFMHG